MDMETTTTSPAPESFILGDRVQDTKLLASVVLFVVTLVCSYLPVRFIVNQRYIEHATFAGGGVLMATAFCHLIPEAHDSYNASKVPYVEITLCCGFFLMYAIEQLMAKFIANHSHERICKDQCDQPQLVSRLDGVDHAERKEAEVCVTIEGGGEFTTTTTTTTNGQDQAVLSRPAAEQTKTTSAAEPSGQQVAKITSSNETSEFYRFARGFMVVAAFGTHLLFDGVAIGSQETSEKVWTLFFAISCHKLIIAVVIGFELFAATLESHRWTLVNLIIFSIMSPLGIILIVIAQDALNISGEHPAMILLQSFATGTLLYIIFVEILQPKDPRPCEHQLSRIFSLILGFFLMLAVFILIDEEG